MTWVPRKALSVSWNFAVARGLLTGNAHDVNLLLLYLIRDHVELVEGACTLSIEEPCSSQFLLKLHLAVEGGEVFCAFL